MTKDQVPEVEVDSCYRCPMRGLANKGFSRRCQLTGAEIKAMYSNSVPPGCPLKGGPVQITLSKRAKETL